MNRLKIAFSIFLILMAGLIFSRTVDPAQASSLSSANYSMGQGATTMGGGSGGSANYSFSAQSTGSSTSASGMASTNFSFHSGFLDACSFSLSTISVSVAAGGESGSSVGVNASSGCSWTASSNASWLTITNGSGTGGGTVTYSVASHTDPSSRTGILTIAGQTFTVTQAGFSCSYAFSPANISVSPGGSRGRAINVTASSVCSWTAFSNIPWVTIFLGSSGTGNGTVSFSVSSNIGPNSRTGDITIEGNTFTVVQDAYGATCSSYAISSTSAAVGAGGATGNSVGVVAASGCAWASSSNVPWISIGSGNTGAGNGTITYTVSANTELSSRTGAMTIAGQTFTVTQAGASCSYTISSSNVLVGSGGASGSSLNVDTLNGCAWTSSSNVPWITITSGSGTGNGTATYMVSSNPDSTSRTGTATIAGQTFTVAQGGGVCSYSISPTSVSVGVGGVVGNSFTVSVPGGCAWVASGNASWITINSGGSGTGNGPVNYSVAANAGVGQRIGSITVTGNTFTITQAGSVPPPNAPKVIGATPTNTTTPTWSWSSRSGGGNGTYRYKLNDSDLTTGATTTTANSFTPAAALSTGTHTLYVQERNGTGSWSSSGSFAITINIALPDPPVVSGSNTPSINVCITWAWTSSGGNGIFRYKLDDPDLSFGATITTATSVTLCGLAPGLHTLYLQEQYLTRALPDATAWSSAVAVSVYAAQPIPTISQWGLIFFGALLLILGMFALKSAVVYGK